MKKKIHFILILCKFFIISILSFALASGCSIFNPVQNTRSRAFIDDGSAGWKIEHGENIYERETDIVVRNDTKIQLSIFRYKNNEPHSFEAKDIFGIIVEFIETNSNYTFSPSDVTLKTNEADAMLARGIVCKDKYVESILVAIRERDYINNSISINPNDCVFLYFEHGVPSIEEEFIVNMGNAIFFDGVLLDIPPIRFTETASNIYRLGFIQ